MSLTGKASLADRVRQGDTQAVSALLSGPLIPRIDNLVERPWGGFMLPKFKGLRSNPQGPRIGEGFELAAWSTDPEANQYPSVIGLEDGSSLTLGEVLAAAGSAALGDQLANPQGLPLLPKYLSVKELLSVQGHPAGNTEIYLILDAEPDATLFLGFSRDQDPAVLSEQMKRGRGQQEQLVALLRGDVSQSELQVLVAPWLAQSSGEDVWPIVANSFPAERQSEVVALLEELRGIYRWTLQQLNEIPVAAGMVLHNKNPDRVLAPGVEPSAEVHALGNPGRKEILALEIRKPGPTFRAWDHVRFPIRPVDVDGAVEALSLRKTAPQDFLVQPRPDPLLAGAELLVEEPGMRVRRLRLEAGGSFECTSPSIHSLHLVGGTATLTTDRDWSLSQGSSALITLGCPRYVIESTGGAELIRVDLGENSG